MVYQPRSTPPPQTTSGKILETEAYSVSRLPYKLVSYLRYIVEIVPSNPTLLGNGSSFGSSLPPMNLVSLSLSTFWILNKHKFT